LDGPTWARWRHREDSIFQFHANWETNVLQHSFPS
jgi:hypothetical protein